MRVVDVDRCSANCSHRRRRWIIISWGEERRAHENANRLVSYDVGDEEKQGYERDGDVKLQTIGRGHRWGHGLWAIAFLFILAMSDGIAILLLFVGHGDDRATLGRGELNSLLLVVQGRKLVANVATSKWFKSSCV
jgi:hypothetical protein